MVETRSRPAKSSIVPPSSVAPHDLSTYSSLWEAPLPPSPPLIGSDLFEAHFDRATPSPQGPRPGGGPGEHAKALGDTPTSMASALARPLYHPAPALHPTKLSTEFVSPTDVFLTPPAMPHLELSPSQDSAQFEFGTGPATSGALWSAASSGAAPLSAPSATTANGTLAKDFDNGSSSTLVSEWFSADFLTADIQVDASDAPFDISPFAHIDFSQYPTWNSSNFDDNMVKLSSEAFTPLFNTAFSAQHALTHSSSFRPSHNEVQTRAMQFDSVLDSPLLDDSPGTLCPSDFDTSPAWPTRSLLATPDLDMDRMNLPEDSEPSSVATTPELVADKSLFVSATVSQENVDEFLAEDGKVDEDDEDDEDEYKPVIAGSRKRKATSATPSAAAAASPSARIRTFNGTRKTQLTAIDAPIQTRNYKGDSKTARKEVPVNMAKTVKGKTAEEAQNKIVAKRKQNTIAARETRQRKADHLAFVENENESLKATVDSLTSTNTSLVVELDALKRQYAALEAHAKGARGF